MKIKHIETEEEYEVTGQINVAEPALVIDEQEVQVGEVFTNYSFANEAGETYSTSFKEGSTNNGTYEII